MTPADIRELRLQLGETQRRFARRFRVLAQTISRWERGETRPGPLAVARLRRLARRR